MKRITTMTATALAIGTVVAACGPDDGPQEGVAVSTPATAEGTSAGEDVHGDDHSGSNEIAADARRIEVLASSFEFESDEIVVKSGEDIAIALTSTDILHDFVIDELDAHVAAGPGETVEGGFTAVEPGTYVYYCSVAGHREAGMEGTLVIE